MVMLAALTLVAAAAAAAQPDAAPGEACAGIHPQSSPRLARAVLPEDLVQLRDIGGDTEFPGEPVFRVSPDGTRAALQLRQADPTTDRYCLAMVVVALTGKARPVTVDTGGQPLKNLYANLNGKADFASGALRTISPVWAPDGSALFYLKQASDTVQVWRAASDGSRSEAFTSAPESVAKFGLLTDGRTLVYATRSGAAAARRAIAAEGLSGYRYDARFSPVVSTTPFPPAPLKLSYFAVDLGNRVSRVASAAEQKELDRGFADVGDGGPNSVWRITDPAPGFPPTTRLQARGADGLLRTCRSDACTNPDPDFSRSADSKNVIFARREGWGQDTTAFYRWEPATGRLDRFFASQDRFLSCQPAGRRLACARETAAVPRHLVILDPGAGATETVFDPNPEFKAARLGRAIRQRWRTNGAQRFADLVYPVGYQRGLRYPLVVVQYISRGFLRGGTGDEYPIQAFAGRGYFVLSMQNPPYGASAKLARTDREVERDDLKDFRARREKLEAIETLVARLVDRGLVDPMRVGITGLSDGASTVQFAGLHSRLFRAGAVSTCCWTQAQDAYLGPGGSETYHAIGWPQLIDPAPKFWAGMSWVSNAARVAFPVLLQLADRELLGALETYTALAQHHMPAALYVYPDEDHIKSHPAHRLATYRRNLAWFDFWLKPEQPARIEDAVFVRDWTTLRSGPGRPAHAAIQ